MVWRLEVGSRSLELGCDLSGVGLMSTPVVKPTVDSSSWANPGGDGRRRGRQYRRGMSVQLSVEARPDHRSADEVWRDLLSVWRADEIRFEPGAQAKLVADTGRFCWGMPVEVEPNQEYRIFDTNRAVLEFEAESDLWYGAERLDRVGFVPPVSGGLTFPAVAPFVFDGDRAEGDGGVLVEGDVATWPVYEITGPVVDPVIDVIGVGQLVFRVELGPDQTLVADTRPWRRSVFVNGAPLPGALSPSGARLSDMSLMPGGYQLVLRGLDPTGSASAAVRSWAAFTSF